jgi:hypothetical protein
MQNWGGNVGDERRNHGRAASCRVECRASEKLVEGGARLLDVRLVARLIRLGTRVRGTLTRLI